MAKDRFVPPSAEGLPPGALESATDGATVLDAWAETGPGRNFLAHALIQLARDGWLRRQPELDAAFDVVEERATLPCPEPQEMTTQVSVRHVHTSESAKEIGQQVARSLRKARRRADGGSA